MKKRNNFSVFDAITYTLRSTFDNFKTWFVFNLSYLALFFFGLVMLLLPAIVSIGRAAQKLPALEQKPNTALQFVAYFVPLLKNNALPLAISIALLFVFFTLIQLGVAKAMLNFYDKGTASVQNFFSVTHLIPITLITNFLYWIMLWTGLLFLVIPGIYVMIRFGLYTFVIVDENPGIIASLKKSYRLTSGHGWQIASLWFATVIIGATVLRFGFFAGIFLSIPLFVLPWAYLYRQLKQKANKNQTAFDYMPKP